MSEAVIRPQKGWPRWASKLIVSIGTPTGLLLAVVAFVGAMASLAGR